MVLWLMVAGFTLFSVRQLTESVRPRGGATSLSGRAAGLATTVVHVVLAYSAFTFAIGDSSSSSQPPAASSQQPAASSQQSVVPPPGFGPYLRSVVAVGLVAYAFYSLAWARHAAV